LLQCAQTPCVQHARPPAAELSVSPREPRTPHRREGTGRARWPGCPRRFAAGLRCFASLGLDREAHHTTPTPSRPGNCFENLRGRRPLSNYAGTALAGCPPTPESSTSRHSQRQPRPSEISPGRRRHLALTLVDIVANPTRLAEASAEEMAYLYGSVEVIRARIV